MQDTQETFPGCWQQPLKQTGSCFSPFRSSGSNSAGLLGCLNVSLVLQEGRKGACFHRVLPAWQKKPVPTQDTQRPFGGLSLLPTFLPFPCYGVAVLVQRMLPRN